MNLFQSMQISASGLNSQRAVIGVIAENMANVHTTRTDQGGPYLRKRAILSPSPIASSPHSPFSSLLSTKMGEEPVGVKVADIQEDIDGVKTVYDPSHPDADEAGLLFLPNVNLMEEMVALLTASRVFEANVTAFNAAKTMAMKSLDIGSR
jgi:flagellar basal-body rod protein FlgC